MTSSILSLMGIDVWTLRPVLQPGTSEIAKPVSDQHSHSSDQSAGMVSLGLLRQQLGSTTAADTEAQHPVTNAKGSDAVSTEKPDEFLFLFMDYSDHSLVIPLPLGSASLPADYRFFADDISRALGGSMAVENPAWASDAQMRHMSWPMLNASHIQHSEEDARALVLQKVKACKHLVIAFGDLPEKYLSAIEPKIKEKQFIYVASVNQYFKTPALKKQLWEQLKPFVAYLNVRRKQ